MDKHIAAKMNMYEHVLLMMNNIAPTWNEKPAFVQLVTELTDKMKEINECHAQRNNPIKPITEEKRYVRKLLNNATHQFSCLITAYALLINDFDLQEAHKHPRSYYILQRDFDFEVHTNRLLKDLHEHAPALIDYGITATELQAFENSFQKWCAVVNAPYMARIHRKTDGKLLRLAVKEMDALIKERLDRMMYSYATEHPEMYFHYKSARMILESHRHKKKEDGNGEVGA